MPGGGLEPQSSVRPQVDDLGFFSRVEQVAMGDKIPNRGSGDQMLATIKKQPGVKEEELKWLGLEDYLRGKKQVTKQELTDFIRENDIQLEETILSGDSYDSYDPDKKTSPTRYGEYQLPGAEDGSYKEMLLRMPSRPSTSFAEYLKSYKDRFPNSDQPIETIREYWRDGHQVPGPGKTVTKIDPALFRSSHFDEPNILAHVRFNDRTGPNGEKILFVEELQSDWHSEGRKLGYTENNAKPQATVLKDTQAELFYLYNFNGDLLGKFPAREEATKKAVNLGYAPVNEVLPHKLNQIVPDAPFKSSWHELATKRMLRYAAENGYDKLAFIDGQSTADRYDLSKRVDKVSVSDDGTGNLTVTADDSLIASDVERNQLERYVGKEVAQKALQIIEDTSPDMSGNRTTVLTDSDLKVGGDWAFNLYDRMIPQFLKKYGKKFGAKVEDVVIDTGIPEPYKAIDITPQMRSEDGVMGGQVRFTPSTPGTRTPTQSTPTSQPVNLVMDKIYRLPDEEKEERKDRAMEILKQFSKP